MARPRTNDEATRDRLLEAAGRLLRQQGPSALTVRRLAAEASTSTTAIYSLLGSKDGVVRAMYRAGFDNLAAHQAAADASDPITRIRQHAMAYRTAARSRPHLYDVMFACPFPEFTPSDDDRAASRKTLDRLHETVAEAVAAGRLVGDPDVLAVGRWALVHGLAMLELGGSLDVETDADEVWESAVSAHLDGLRGG